MYTPVSKASREVGKNFKVIKCPTTHCINTVSCPIKFNCKTIELIMHTSCYCILDLLCVNSHFYGMAS